MKSALVARLDSDMAHAADPTVAFETEPDRYHHWKLTVDGPIAHLSMDVREHAGLSPDYQLKLNSYDLGVDVELADAVQRVRFEHPQVRTVIIGSLKDRVFCAGANIMMLRGSTHNWKVNFCKFTNETRFAMEDASQHSGLKFIAALNGICAGGGYELALACDEILLVDDGNSAVSLPEAPLLAVLPGTGGLTRVVDKRHVRRDLADYFCTLVEGIRGKRAVTWRLVDAVFPTSQFNDAVQKRAEALADGSTRPATGAGIRLNPLGPSITDSTITYSSVSATFDRPKRTAALSVHAPEEAQPTTPAEIAKAGDQFWPLRTFRELDDLLLRLRVDEQEIGTIVIRTGRQPGCRACGRSDPRCPPVRLARQRDHPLHEAHTEAARPHCPDVLRIHRTGLSLRRFAARTRACRRPVVHAERRPGAERHSTLADECGPAAYEQRTHPPPDPVPR